MSLYLNGALENQVAFFDKLSGLNDVNNWLGKSQFGTDAEFGGTIHEFRIYDAALDAAEIKVSFDAGPQAVFPAPKSTVLTRRFSFSGKSIRGAPPPRVTFGALVLCFACSKEPLAHLEAREQKLEPGLSAGTRTPRRRAPARRQLRPARRDAVNGEPRESPAASPGRWPPRSREPSCGPSSRRASP